MATPSARDMLMQVKRYAEGGTASMSMAPVQSDGLTRALDRGLTEDQYYANIRSYAAANTNPLEALNAMTAGGVSMADANRALGAKAVSDYFTIDPNQGEKAPSAAVATNYISPLQQGWIDTPNHGQAALDARIREVAQQNAGNPEALRNLFVQERANIADLQRAGVDPSVLYATVPLTTAKPPQPPPPPVVTPGTQTQFPQPTPYTPTTVYQPIAAPPPIYGAGQPALDVAFRNSAPRTWDPRYGYTYTPAAKLLPATGAGMSWTPPSVTSRPRDLLNIPLSIDTGKPYKDLTPEEKANLRLSASQTYARDRQAAQQLAALPGGRFSGMQAPVAPPLDPNAPVDPYGVKPTEFRNFAPPPLTGVAKAVGGEIKKSEGTADPSARAMLDNLDSEAPVKRNLPKEAQDARRARIGQAPAVPQDYSGRDLTGELLNVASLATAPVPVLGDIAGLAADARMYQMHPEERTMGNYALSALGVLPFVPSVSAVKTVGKGVKTAAKEAKIRLYRASPDDYVTRGTSFTEDAETARAYQDNPGFGGSEIYSTRINPKNVLDLSDEEDQWMALSSAIGEEIEPSRYAYHFARSLTADDSLTDKLAESGVDWIKFRDDFPEGSKTWIPVSDKAIDNAYENNSLFNPKNVESALANKGVKTAAEDLLDLSQEAKAARQVEQGYAPQDFYHATYKGFDAFDPDMVGLGTHIGTAEQANNRLKFFSKNLTGPGAEIGSNIIPLKARLGKTLEMNDVGQWNDSFDVLRSFRRNMEETNLKDYSESISDGVRDFSHPITFDKKQLQRVDDLLAESDEMQAEYRDAITTPIKFKSFLLDESDQMPVEYSDDITAWIKSPENKKLLDKTKKLIQGMGYDSIRYINRVENAPDNFDSSYIVLDPKNLRAKTADYDPSKLESSDLGHADGGLIQKYATGNEVSSTTADLLAQMKAIGDMPNTKTPDPAPTREQTESQNMLKRLDAASAVEQEVYKMNGMEPGLDRASILPFAGSRKQGNLQFAAPQMLYDLVKAGVAPGVAASGRQVSNEDALNTALNITGGSFGASHFAGPAAEAGKNILGMAVKNEGGNWLKGDIAYRLKPLKQYQHEGGQNYSARPDPLNAFVDKQLTDYVQNKMGTPTDTLRIIADKYAEERPALLAAAQAKIDALYAKGDRIARERGVPRESLTQHRQDEIAAEKAKALIEARQPLHRDDIGISTNINNLEREAAGLPVKGYSVSEAARRYENLADVMIVNRPARDWQKGYISLGQPSRIMKALEENPWLKKVSPETPVYEMQHDTDHLGFDHLIDELRNAVNPDSGLPKELLINPKDLPKITMEQAVNRVADINAWRSVNRREANFALANNPATFVHKQYPDGMKWVQIKRPDDLPEGWTVDEVGKTISPEGKYAKDPRETAVSDALKYEGDTMINCVGGYCDRVLGGKSEIFSLRNDEGQPFATIEVQPSDIITPEKRKAEIERFMQGMRNEGRSEEEMRKSVMRIYPESEILPLINQIKGIDNGVVEEKYWPLVQDFINSGAWSKVRENTNAGLLEIDVDSDLAKSLTQKGIAFPAYATQQEITNLLKQAQVGVYSDWRQSGKIIRAEPLPEEFAGGGAVRGYERGGSVQKYATGNEVSSPKQTIEAIEPSLRDTIQQFIYDKMGGANSPEARARANRYSDIASSAVDWIPGVGDAVSASDALADYQRGNYGQAAIGAGLTALGAVPVVGDVAAKGVKTAAKELADTKLARAAKQGYADQDFYHATKADITEFDADQNKLGLTFLGTNPEFANQIIEDIGWRRRLGTEDMENKDIQNLKNRITGTDYTQSDFYRDKNYLNKEYNFTDSTIYPLRTNLQNAFDPAQESDLLSEYLWNTGVDPQGYSYHWADPIDESFEPKNLTNVEALERGGWRDFENKEMIDFLKSKGFDSMWLRENYLKPDFKMSEPYSTLAKFDTSKIRSKFAEFDPDKLESRNIGHAKGGPVQKYATGNEVSSNTKDLIAQMNAIGATPKPPTPNAKTPNAPPAKEQTDSAKFLAGLLGLAESPRNIVDNLVYHSLSELGGDLSGAAKNVTAGLTDATFGMRDLAKTGGNWIGDKLMEQGLPLGTFLKFASNQPSNIPSAQEVKETLGVENANVYSPSYVLGSIGPSLVGSGVRNATTLTAKYGPQLAEELGAYVGGDTAANLMATLFPNSTPAQIAGAVVGNIGGGAGINATARNVDVPSNVMASLGDDVPAANMPADFNNAESPLAPQSDVPTIGATPLDFDKVFRDAGLLTTPVSVDPLAVGHGLPPILLVGGNNKKATVPVTQEFTPANKNTVISNINTVIAQHPKALNSTQNWLSAEEEAFGGSFLPAEPSQAIIYNQTPSELARKLDGLTPKLKATVDEGFGHVAEIKNIYNAGLAAPDLTGRLFMWGILSRGAGPVQQEAAFLDIMDGASPFIDKAARGDFTEADIPAWNEMVTSSLPEGSPSKQVTMNANAAGRLLLALSHKPEGGFKTVLQTLHESLADPKTSGNDFRRKFFELTNKPGIDNKVVSFIGLVGGKTDLLVMDRIQSRHLWDNGKYEGKNIYDGIDGTGLNKILAGPRGLMITEMLERGLKDSVTKAYAMIGRPQDASLARMHWETWLIEGNQGVSHSTLQNVRSGSSIGGGVTEGKPGTFSSGITYRQTINGSIVEYPLSDGTLVRMTPEKQKEFEMYIKNSKNGIVPKGFKVSDSIDKPWFERSEINREKLDNAAKQFENANPDGTLRSGDVRPNQSGSTLSKRRSEFLNTFRADQNQTLRGRYYASGDSSGNYSASSGPYRREGIAGDDGNGLLTFSPDSASLIQYNSAGLSVPTIRQVNAATDAVKYNADMTQAMSINPFGAQVEIKNPKELAEMRLFRTESGSGFGIKDDGDIVSIFSSANEPKHGSYAMLQAAVAAGGKKLDAFDTYLPNIYERVGFRPVARLPWNDDFAPPNWDKSIFAEYNNGKPDVIFFVHDPDYFGGATDVPKITNFDDGAKLQNDALTRNVERQGIGSLLTEKLEGQSVNTDGTALTPVNTPDKARGGPITKKAKGGNVERVYNDRKYI